jgi:hypothetical protein
MFASPSTLAFNLPSRKDDLLSICYILIFMLNGCELPFVESWLQESQKEQRSNLEVTHDFKVKYSITTMIQEL